MNRIHFRKELTALCKIYRKLVANCYSSASKAGTSLTSNARQQASTIEAKFKLILSSIGRRR